MDCVKCTLRGSGFLGADGTDALRAGLALLFLACRSGSAFSFSAQLFRYLRYQTLRPQHAKPNAVRPPMMTAMV